MTAVTVPCASPVGTARIPAASRSSTTRSGGSGVARSISLTGRPASASRTQPPTNRTSAPCAVSAARRFTVSSALIQGWGSSLGAVRIGLLVVAGNQLSVLEPDRHIGRAGLPPLERDPTARGYQDEPDAPPAAPPAGTPEKIH